MTSSSFISPREPVHLRLNVGTTAFVQQHDERHVSSTCWRHLFSSRARLEVRSFRTFCCAREQKTASGKGVRTTLFPCVPAFPRPRRTRNARTEHVLEDHVTRRSVRDQALGFLHAPSRASPSLREKRPPKAAVPEKCEGRPPVRKCAMPSRPHEVEEGTRQVA